MKKVRIRLPEIKIVGLSARTSNKLEMDQNTASIGATINKFYKDNIIKYIKNIASSDKFYSIYADYESDHNVSYTYFYGVEVTSFEGVDDNLAKYTIPIQDYAKFTTERGKMPDVVISAWMSIWKMTDEDFGGKRNYIADFEIHDKRSADPLNGEVDIYIGKL
jgi:predicted transcriptional regulator YdeE